MGRTNAPITKRRVSLPTMRLTAAAVTLLDQDTDFDEIEHAAYDSSISAAALRDWPEIAGDVDEWVRERGGRGDAGRDA